jgi:DNA-binding transcriptional ArsR family regulator
MRSQLVTDVIDQSFRALADPLRRRILALLQQRPRPVEEIASHFPVSRPAVSRHLRVLREAGLIREQRSGRQRFYDLVPDELQPARRWLDGLLTGSAPEWEVEAPAGASVEGSGDDWRSW